ncbi:MAG: four helix bundle protein [Bacteroidetes bacterium]|nr:four helix bundle protein [Bacteroidota bacterium]MBS1617727.1 four helix bundle protein [Bacteroidota bacterium]
MHDYKQLKVWNKAIDLVVDVYKATGDFPKEEKYGLISQMRRCAVSIPSNIAEGAGRNSDKEFCHFLSIAHGSSYELETQLIVSQRLELIDSTSSDALCARINEVQKMSYNLQSKLNSQN